MMTFNQFGLVNIKVKMNSVKGIGTGMFVEEVNFKIPVEEK